MLSGINLQFNKETKTITVIALRKQGDDIVNHRQIFSPLEKSDLLLISLPKEEKILVNDFWSDDVVKDFQEARKKFGQQITI